MYAFSQGPLTNIYGKSDFARCKVQNGLQLRNSPAHVEHVQYLFKVPLTCKIFNAEKDSVLLVDKLRDTLSCKQRLHGGENRGFSCQNLLLCN